MKTTMNNTWKWLIHIYNFINVTFNLHLIPATMAKLYLLWFNYKCNEYRLIIVVELFLELCRK